MIANTVPFNCCPVEQRYAADSMKHFNVADICCVVISFICLKEIVKTELFVQENRLESWIKIPFNF